MQKYIQIFPTVITWLLVKPSLIHILFFCHHEINQTQSNFIMAPSYAIIFMATLQDRIPRFETIIAKTSTFVHLCGGGIFMMYLYIKTF